MDQYPSGAYMQTAPHMAAVGRTFEPKWGTTPFGELCSGLFWEAHEAWRHELRLATVWTWCHYCLGILAVVLAGIAGFGGLADLLGKQATAVIALASGVVAGVATFLQSDSKRQQHSAKATAWDSFRDDISTIFATRPEGPSPGKDPARWRLVTTALQQRATALRAGKPDPHTRPSGWEVEPPRRRVRARKE